MATPQLSPGVLVREVDLTVGRADNVLDNIGAIAGPFSIGPVDYPVDIATEQDLINFFGKPLQTDAQYEYWMSASSYLSYGGVLKVVRTDGDYLVNANARRIRGGEITGISTTNVSYSLGSSVGVGTTVSGSFTLTETDYSTSGNGTGAIITVSVASTNGTAAALVSNVVISNGGVGFTTTDSITISNTKLGAVGVGTTGSITLDITDIYTTSGVSTVGTPDLKITNFDNYNAVHSDDIANYIFAAKNPGAWANNLKVAIIDDKADQTISVGSTFAQTLTARSDNGIGLGVTVALVNQNIPGVTTSFNGYLKGIITGVQTDSIDVKIVSRVAAGSSTDIPITYQERNQSASIRPGNTLRFTEDGGASAGVHTLSSSSSNVKDWYDQQTIDLDNGTIFWKSLAPKPITNKFSLDRNSKNDAIHVAVFDDNGKITGVQGTLLEKHTFISKATDSVSAVNSPQKIWWKEYLAQYSKYIYVGDNPSDGSNNEEVFATGFSEGFAPYTTADGLWNEPTQDKVFSAIGNALYSLQGGNNYGENPDTETGSFTPLLGDLLNSYDLFSNRDEIEVDYLIMGPGLSTKDESQFKASYLVSIAEQRKDCVAVLSPHRLDVIGVTNTNDQTDNIIGFFSLLPSSSYAVFDSGYKYTYDRFNNKFVYIPCNADVAGLMCRTNIVAYPWFSPAGQQRGILNNAIKLAYNPNKAQRDKLYPNRINSIVTQPGIGTLLFGDKTALGYASAFDRINVRRLFLTVEQALQKAAQAQLFELNDELTRANFKNIVEPYLRDVQSKRGLYGFLVVCDTTNNTPDVIDNNEFRADIYLKPAKSINYITLTFVATRTGVSFDEVAGTV
jgi:hypothetical protein